ncbi:MAG TPA: LssY C-terminal domain-containing protein, partial [Paraburkholderia sp.]|nr:LssY C-terminal domain-containing protein [Paraburkholderia sp.]
QKYFLMHGTKSVVFARFAAPLRAIIPVVAGMMGMPRARFLAVNIGSALLWAPVHILPGVIFGASMQLAGAVSFRLVVVAAIALLCGWVTFSLARVALSHARAWTVTSRQRVVGWARRHPGATARLVLRVLDPANPATGLLATISLLLLASGVVFFSVLGQVMQGKPVVQLDMSVYRFFQSYHSSWADALAAVLSTLGSVPTLTALAVLVVVWMSFEHRWHTVLYWLVALLFSQLLVLSIQVAREGPEPAALGATIHNFPSDHVAATVVIYGFLAFLMVRRVGALAGVLIATATISIVAAIALAGLYSGRFLFSDALGGAALAAIWVFAVALTAVWRNPAKPVARPLMPVAVLLVLGVSVAAQPLAMQHQQQDTAIRTPSVSVVTPAQWTDTVWRMFSCYRSNMEGGRTEPITIQWAATADQITAQLLDRGWIIGTPLSMRSVLSLVSPNVSAIDLPALPKLNNGEPSTLIFTRADSTDQRDVLRFWSTDYAITLRNSASPVPVWLGSVIHERLVRPSWPFNVLRPDRRRDALTLERGNTPLWHDLQVARYEGCAGVMVTLIASKVP